MRPISHAHIARPEDHRTGWWCTVTLVVVATLVGCNQTEDSSGSSDPDGGNDDATTGSDADLCGDGLVEGVEWCDPGPRDTCEICRVDAIGQDGARVHIIRSDEADHRLGRFVATAGDVDGDGSDEIIATWFDSVSRASLWFGEDLRKATPGQVLGLSDARIHAVAAPYGIVQASSLGDIDGDGLDEVVFGVPNIGSSSEPGGGAAYVFLGSQLAAMPWGATLDVAAEASYAIIGEVGSGALGAMVASAGDVDGDGRPDLLLGAPGLEGSEGGPVLLVLGSTLVTRMPGGPDSVLSASEVDYVLSSSIVEKSVGGGSCESISAAGDVDGDGLGDLIFSYGNYAEAGQILGLTHLVYGSSLIAAGPASQLDAATAAAYTFVGVVDEEWDIGPQTGYDISSAGDVDGDGRDDLLIGAPQATGISPISGAAHLLLAADVLALPFGSTLELGQDSSYVLSGELSSDFAGLGVAGGGDIDGDGQGELLVGASFNNEGGTNAGAVYVMDGAELLEYPRGTMVSLAEASAVLLGNSVGAELGNSVEFTADVDGDGRSELVVGAIEENGAAANAGAVYVVYAPPPPS